MLPRAVRSRFALLLVGLALGAPGLFTAARGQDATAPAPEFPLETWQSPALGLRLTPPRGWTVTAGPTAESVVMQPREGKAQIAFLSLALPGAGEGAATGPAALAEEAIASLKQRVEHFKLLEQHASAVAGLEAQEVYFRGKVGGEKFRWVQTLFVRNAQQVIVMYAAPEERFERHLGDYDQTLRSIRVVP